LEVFTELGSKNVENTQELLGKLRLKKTSITTRHAIESKKSRTNNMTIYVKVRMLQFIVALDNGNTIKCPYCQLPWFSCGGNGGSGDDVGLCGDSNDNGESESELGLSPV
jgi:hypothetical protein